MFSHHESCPKCGSRDNLGVWDDGHKFCFGCKYYVPSKIFTPKKELKMTSNLRELPSDCTDALPEHVTAWLNKYDITPKEIIKYKFCYSPSRDWLVMPFFDDLGKSMGYQARNMGKFGQKYYTFTGPNFINLYYGPNIDVLILVEDIISAIKVARRCSSVALLGSHISNEKLLALKDLDFKVVIPWLDRDKLDESVKVSRRASGLGLSSTWIYTQSDPKCYTDVEISMYIDNALSKDKQERF